MDFIKKLIKLPGAPTTSNILVEESSGGGIMYVTQSSYDAGYVTFNKTAKEIIDAFESGIDVRVKLDSETDVYPYETGEYSLIGYYNVSDFGDYTIIFKFTDAIDSTFYGAVDLTSPLLYYMGD